MKYILDTNICSYIIKHRPIQVYQKFKSLSMHDCALSSVTVSELYFWIARNKRLHAKSKNKDQPRVNEEIIEKFISHFDVLEFDLNAARVSGTVRDVLESKGKLIGANDLLIGSHALSHECVLVTNNLKELKRIPGLKCENWI